MSDIEIYNIDEETIRKVGLRRSEKHIDQFGVESRVFEYPNLDDVFIMESDLYGNKMPKHSCFLAFVGSHGMMGKHLLVETLKNASVDEIREMVQANIEG